MTMFLAQRSVCVAASKKMNDSQALPFSRLSHRNGARCRRDRYEPDEAFWCCSDSVIFTVCSKDTTNGILPRTGRIDEPRAAPFGASHNAAGIVATGSRIVRWQ